MVAWLILPHLPYNVYYTKSLYDLNNFTGNTCFAKISICNVSLAAKQ